MITFVTKVIPLVRMRNRHPFNTYRVGEYLRIDLDKTSCQPSISVIFDDDMVRKVSSPTNIINSSGSSSDIVVSPSAVNYMKSPEAMEMAHRMSRMVDETGKN